jgi:competence protein ComEC
VKLLSPCPAFVPERGANDNSLVLRVTLGARAFLLTGDAEAAAESELLARAGPELAADVLKAGHHGSRTSTGEAFAQRVAPSFAVLSCGARNRFGHPAPEVVERLARLGARAFRTDRDGSVSFGTDGARLDVSTARAEGSDGPLGDAGSSSAGTAAPSLTPLLARALLRLAPARGAADVLGLHQ